MIYAFCGDRQIAVEILAFMIKQGFPPVILVLSDQGKATHDKELIELVTEAGDCQIFRGNDINSNTFIEVASRMSLDYAFSIHFPYIITALALRIPKRGFINLHPSFLPFNKGWHTPSWPILEKTPAGASLHYMAEELDAGDIIIQQEVIVRPEHTANSLYEDILRAELDIFKEIFPNIMDFSVSGIKQPHGGSSHSRKQLSSMDVQEICLNKSYQASDLIDRLRALTTNNVKEAAYFIKHGKKYRIQVEITVDDD